MIGCGVGIGFSQVGRVTPAWLAQQLIALHGSNLIGLAIPDDASQDLSSLPMRVGGTLTNQTANSFSPGLINGRRALLQPDATLQRLLGGATLSTAPRSVLVVAVTPTLPFTSYYSTVEANIYGSIMCAQNTSNLYTGQNWTHRVDGVATEVMTAGAHIIEGARATGVNAAVGIGNLAGAPASWNWQAPVGAVRFLAVPVTDTNIRAAELAIFRRYYRLT